MNEHIYSTFKDIFREDLNLRKSEVNDILDLFDYIGTDFIKELN